LPKRGRFAVVLALLVLAQYALRPRLGDPRFAPDFLLIGVLFLALRTRPAVGAVRPRWSASWRATSGTCSWPTTCW
jgi:hypothetical protein